MRKTVRKKAHKTVYDDEFKSRVVQEYQLTNQATATARRYGIGRSTLLLWVKNASSFKSNNESITQAYVQAINDTSTAVVRSIEANVLSRQEFMREHYAEVSEALIYNLRAITNRLKENPKSIPFRDLAASLTALNGMIKEFLPVEEQGVTQINLLQQTVNNK